MASFIITASSTTAQTLNLLEVGAITSSGALAVVADAVTITNYAALSVNGSITTMGSGVSLAQGGQITVGADGVINANNSAIRQFGSASSNIFVLNNAGAMAGSDGVFVVGSTAIVTNSGSIISYNGNGVTLSGLGVSPNNFVNSGSVNGALFGFVSNGTVTERITNADGGVISGRSGAMSLSDAVSLVVNDGLLNGSVALGGGADRFEGTHGLQGAVSGGAGNDTIWGGAGDDNIFGDDDNDRLRGGAGDDTVAGGNLNDVLSGAAGNDEILGDDGADTAFGGAGDDDLSGGIGLDLLQGGEGDDILRGGGDADRLLGGLGDDTLNGGAGADTFVFLRYQGTDRITEFANDVDKLDLRAFDFANVAAVVALASANPLGLRIDLPGEGVLFVAGLTLAQLNAADLLL